MSLESYILKSMDYSLEEYISSVEYQQQNDKIDQLTKELEAGLDDREKDKLTTLLELINDCDGRFASQAYLRGVAEGIAFGDKVLR